MKHRTRSFRRFVTVAALVLVMAMLMSGCSEILDLPEPVSEPASGTILSGYAPDDASQIEVIQPERASSVVSLKDASGTTLISFYVRAGDTVTVNVPREMMYVHFASGTTWYGEELLFGEDTIYQEDGELTDFVNSTWTYSIDPYVDTEEDSGYQVQQAQEEEGYIADLGGNWESVHLKDGNFSLSVSALAFSEPVYNVTEMTVNMNVAMNAGTNCKDWQVWGRSGNTFVKIAKIYLAAGDGYVSQTISFDSPVSFDAIAVTPTIVGGYSWSMNMSVTDVWYAE